MTVIAEIDTALEAEYAAAAAQDPEARAARVAALLEQRAGAAKAETEARADADAELEASIRIYLSTCEEVLVAAARYCEARETESYRRANYEAAWSTARKLGLEVPERIAPLAFPKELHHRLLAAGDA